MTVTVLGLFYLAQEMIIRHLLPPLLPFLLDKYKQFFIPSEC